MQDSYDKENQKIANLFNSVEGKEVLSILFERYCDTTIADPKQEPSYAYYNEGKAYVVRNIKYLIEEYKTR